MVGFFSARPRSLYNTFPIELAIRLSRAGKDVMNCYSKDGVRNSPQDYVLSEYWGPSLSQVTFHSSFRF